MSFDGLVLIVLSEFKSSFCITGFNIRGITLVITMGDTNVMSMIRLILMAKKG